jgi:hypothetical protein
MNCTNPKNDAPIAIISKQIGIEQDPNDSTAPANKIMLPINNILAFISSPLK